MSRRLRFRAKGSDGEDDEEMVRPRTPKSQQCRPSPPLLQLSPSSIRGASTARLTHWLPPSIHPPYIPIKLYCSLLLRFLGVAILLFLFCFFTLTGDPYEADGGILGQSVDRYLLHLWRRKQYGMIAPNVRSIVYPNVLVKATRRKQKAQPTRYLNAILSQHQPNQTNIEWNGPEPYVESKFPRRSIHITGNIDTLSVTKANPMTTDLRAESCTTNWVCQRCLSAPFAGTYAMCSALCRRCYIRIMNTVFRFKEKEQDLHVLASIVQQDQFVIPNRRIPRLLHQVLLPDTNNNHTVTPLGSSLDFPERARIRHAWRSQPHYEYRLYTTAQQVELLQEDFPPTFYRTWKRLSPSGRIFFFQLVVLFKFGGVVASIDWMPETNLDAVIDSQTALVVSECTQTLDTCLSRHFIAAEPGDPVIGRAIENILRAMILGSHNSNGGIERYIVASSPYPHSTELWKLRALENPEEFVFGGCALGVALNQVLQNDSPVEAMRVGRQKGIDNGGDILVLLMSPDDMGALRMTDMERNLLVASSDFLGMDGFSIKQRSINWQSSRKVDLSEVVE